MPSVQPGLFRALFVPVLPVIALDISHMSVTSESAPLDGRFHDVGITTEEGRVLRDLRKLYTRLQDVLGAESSMTTRDQGKAVSSLVAAKTATLRTSRLPASKINVLLEPVLSVIKLLRPR